MPRLDKKVENVALSLDQLLKLLGGTADQRERFWEIVKGITTPVQYRLTNAALTAVQTELKSAHNMLSDVKAAAGEIQKER